MDLLLLHGGLSFALVEKREDSWRSFRSALWVSCHAVQMVHHTHKLSQLCAAATSADNLVTLLVIAPQLVTVAAAAVAAAVMVAVGVVMVGEAMEEAAGDTTEFCNAGALLTPAD